MKVSEKYCFKYMADYDSDGKLLNEPLLNQKDIDYIEHTKQRCKKCGQVVKI